MDTEHEYKWSTMLKKEIESIKDFISRTIETSDNRGKIAEMKNDLKLLQECESFISGIENIDQITIDLKENLKFIGSEYGTIARYDKSIEHQKKEVLVYKTKKKEYEGKIKTFRDEIAKIQTTLDERTIESQLPKLKGKPVDMVVQALTWGVKRLQHYCKLALGLKKTSKYLKSINECKKDLITFYTAQNTRTDSQISGHELSISLEQDIIDTAYNVMKIASKKSIQDLEALEKLNPDKPFPELLQDLRSKAQDSLNDARSALGPDAPDAPDEPDEDEYIGPRFRP